MKKVYLITLVLFCLTQTAVIGQAGKIIPLSEAESQFGKVEHSITVKTNFITNALEKTKENILFKIEGNQLIILNDSRGAIYPKNYVPKESEVFRLFSKKIVAEFLRITDSLSLEFQLRGSTLTIQNGSYVLEYSYPCPPLCN